jgi:hypothetical protein
MSEAMKLSDRILQTGQFSTIRENEAQTQNETKDRHFVDRLTGDDLRKRLMAIATNAVREARVAIGRDYGPWIDEDAARQALIFEALYLPDGEDIVPDREHFDLVSKGQMLPDDASRLVDRLSDSLRKTRVSESAKKESER